ncbi:MAG TPA: alpha/beta hydrolase [Candidatus Saccharimonadales bacterium]|nr:alpha/beta hydrolase [Candidatus Saccharimonadales bacterium]
MASFESKILHIVQRLSRLMPSEYPINDANLAAKRRGFNQKAKLIPVSDWVTITDQKIKGVKAEWIEAPESRPNSIMLYMHGGGFVLGGSHLHRDLISKIARAGRVRALSIDYSLAPEHPFPAALNEVITAYKWLLAQKFKPDHIIIAGDSAGAALTLSALLTIRNNKLPLPAGGVVIAPPTDATLNSLTPYSKRKIRFHIGGTSLPYFISSYFQDTPRDDPIASPIHSSLKSLPPLLIHVSDQELLYGDSTAFAKKAKRQGVDVDMYIAHNLPHVWHLFSKFLPEAREAIEDIGDFIRERIPD